MNESEILRVENLQLILSKSHILRGVDFSIGMGERIAIVGESGCGKSFTAKAILGLLPRKTQKKGRILFNNKNLFDFSEREMRKIRGKEIGMIFQDSMSSLNPTMKIGQQIQEAYLQHYPQTKKTEAKQKVLELLHLVGIPNPLQRYFQYPHELSGGMRQRIMIAIALAPSPHLLIADEPTTALDATIQAQILDLLKDIQKKTKKSILLITHDLGIVAGFCDKILVMYAGQIIEYGEVNEIFYRPKHPYTQLLLKSIPSVKDPLDILTPITGSPPHLSQIKPGCSFCDRCPFSVAACQVKAPTRYIVTDSHQVHCWLYEPKEKNAD